MASPIVLSTLPILGGTTAGGTSAFANYLPILNSSGQLDASFVNGDASLTWPLVSTDGHISLGSTAGTAAYINDNGAILGLTYNGNTLTAGTGTLNLSTFTLTASANATLSGTNTGDQTITITGDATGSGTGSFATVVHSINGVSLASLATGILKNTTSTGHPSIAIASDFPTLNQNTTGNAATVTGLSIASGKTLTASNTLTLAGTDSSTLNIGTGGTLTSISFVAPGTGVDTALAQAVNTTNGFVTLTFADGRYDASGTATALLSSSNTWTGTQLFNNNVAFDSGATLSGLPISTVNTNILYASKLGATCSADINTGGAVATGSTTSGSAIVSSISYTGSATFTGTLVAGTNLVTVVSSFTGIAAGMVVTGTGINAGTTVVHYEAASSEIILSQNVITSGSAVSMTAVTVSGIHLNQIVTGTGIPTNTTVILISGSTITLSANATVTGTPTLTFTPQNDTTVLQAALNKAGSLGNILLVIDAGVCAISSLNINYSNTSIYSPIGNGLWCISGTNDTPVKINFGVYGAAQTLPIENISIEGLTVNGNGMNQAKLETGTTNQWNFGIIAMRVSNLVLRDVTVRNAKTFAFALAQTSDAVFDNCWYSQDTYISTFGNNNWDGFHFYGGNYRMRFHNCGGGGDDDCIALNANEGADNALNLVPVDSRFSTTEVTISDIIFDKFMFVNPLNATRWFEHSGAPVPTVKNITFRHMYGAALGATSGQTLNPSNVLFDDWNVILSTNGTQLFPSLTNVTGYGLNDVVGLDVSANTGLSTCTGLYGNNTLFNAYAPSITGTLNGNFTINSVFTPLILNGTRPSGGGTASIKFLGDNAATGTEIEFDNPTTGAHNFILYGAGSTNHPGWFAFYDATAATTPFAFKGASSANLLQLASDTSLTWNSTAGNSTANAADTGLSRDSAGVVDFDTTTRGNKAGSWKATNGTLLGTLTLGSISGLLKGTSGVIGAATAGTDYVSPTGAGAIVADGSFSGTGTATTSFTVTIGSTMPNSTYKLSVTPTSLLAVGLYVTAKTTTTFTITLPAATGTVTFDWLIAL